MQALPYPSPYPSPTGSETLRAGPSILFFKETGEITATLGMRTVRFRSLGHIEITWELVDTRDSWPQSQGLR